MAKSFTQNGIGMNDAYNHYLAYHEGHAGHRRGSFRAKSPGCWVSPIGSPTGQPTTGLQYPRYSSRAAPDQRPQPRSFRNCRRSQPADSSSS